MPWLYTPHECETPAPHNSQHDAVWQCPECDAAWTYTITAKDNHGHALIAGWECYARPAREQATAYVDAMARRAQQEGASAAEEEHATRWRLKNARPANTAQDTARATAGAAQQAEHHPALDAALAAWVEPGPRMDVHENARAEVRRLMPALGQALDRAERLRIKSQFREHTRRAIRKVVEGWEGNRD